MLSVSSPKSLFTLVTLTLTAVLGIEAFDCPFPPHLWCSSHEIAETCKVYQQCKPYFSPRAGIASPVKLDLYYESLCPDCRGFITELLVPTFNKLGTDVMNITLIPYGNANEKKSGSGWSFECQHGEQECIGNLLETCALHVMNSVPSFMPLLDCMEKSNDMPLTAFQKCASRLSIPSEAILRCYNSSLGNQLEHQMALKTEALQPQHQYVPWIVLNGVHTEKMNDEATKDLLKLICKTYTGPTPDACQRIEDSPKTVCHRSKTFH